MTGKKTIPLYTPPDYPQEYRRRFCCLISKLIAIYNLKTEPLFKSRVTEEEVSLIENNEYDRFSLDRLVEIFERVNYGDNLRLGLSDHFPALNPSYSIPVSSEILENKELTFDKYRELTEQPALPDILAEYETRMFRQKFEGDRSILLLIRKIRKEFPDNEFSEFLKRLNVRNIRLDQIELIYSLLKKYYPTPRD